jgi:hypothetical protein
MKNLRFLSFLAAMLPAMLAAQQTFDSRWLPWLGCWQPGEAAGPDSLLVCVRPTADQRGVEVATVSIGEVAATRTLIADGQPHDLSVENCSGAQFAEFSADGHRVYLWSTLTCDQGRKRSASAIMAMGSRTEWLDVQALGMNGERMPRVLRYRPAAEARWPVEFTVGAQRAEAVADARLLAASRVSLADVEEAATHVDHEALAAFVIERGHKFDLSAAKLAALDDAGIPAEVIDAVVAASYPERFVIDREGFQTALNPDQPRERGGVDYGDPFGWGWGGYGQCYMGVGYWSPYCGSFLYGLGYGYGGYWPYGYDSYYGYGGYWGRPVIVVRDPNSGTQDGAAVRGGGYTRGGQPAGGTGRVAQPRGGQPTQNRGTAQPRRQPEPDRSSSPSAGSGSSSGSRGGSASSGGYTRSGGSSSSGSSSGSAKPKCCS